jgi:RimJ/RimL family protein N-acetyltransferase
VPLTISLGKLELAQFTPRDARELHRLRNHASVRPRMANAGPIAYRAHAAWVRAHLGAEPRLLLFLVRVDGKALGFTLLKPVETGRAEIGVVVAEADQHAFVAYTAAVLTLHCAFDRLGLAALVSYVLPAHRRAIAMNRSFGAREIESDKPDMLKFALDRQTCLQNPNYAKVLGRAAARLTITGSTSVAF